MNHNPTNNNHFEIHYAPKAQTKLPPIKYPHYLAGIVGEGHFKISVGLTEFEAGPGTIWFVAPQQIYTCEDVEEASQAYYVTFSPDYALKEYDNKKLLDELPFFSPLHRPYAVLREAAEEKVYMLFEAIHEEYAGKRVNKDALIRLKLIEILLTTERYFKEAYLDSLTRTADLISRFKVLIEEHFRAHLPPSAYAAMLDVHPNYLNRAVKTLTNRTCSETINERVKLEAQSLLTFTSLSVPEVSEKLGFAETTHFTRFFRKQTGMSPVRFRKNHQLQDEPAASR